MMFQFSSVKDQGTRIVIYNLWEDDQGELELDFDADEHVSSNYKLSCHLSLYIGMCSVVGTSAFNS